MILLIHLQKFLFLLCLPPPNFRCVEANRLFLLLRSLCQILVLLALGEAFAAALVDAPVLIEAVLLLMVFPADCPGVDCLKFEGSDMNWIGGGIGGCVGGLEY